MNSMKLPSEDFNRDTLVLKRRVGLIREHVAPISERDLANTHIKFFNDHNPGWRQVRLLVFLSREGGREGETWCEPCVSFARETRWWCWQS